MNAGEVATAVRRGVGLFPMPSRGLIEVSGDDRERWLDGMVSNHIAALSPGPERSGCYATLLTAKGRVVTDLHVLLRGEELWLETASALVPGVIEHLSRYIIADDVELEDAGTEHAQLSLEGPKAPAILEAAVGHDLGLAPEACDDAVIGGHAIVVAAFGWTGEHAFRLFVPSAGREVVESALMDVGAPQGLVAAGAEVLEVLRIAAGTPLVGTELDDSVLPDEARLERAISTEKGCYVGQEIVARLRSRGRVNHLLVGLSFAGDAPPPADTPLCIDDKQTGEVTSACCAPGLGVIGLGFVRREHAEPGTALTAEGTPATVRALPMLPGNASREES